MKTLHRTYALLMLLLLLSVAVSLLPLGHLGSAFSLAIATAKASLILLFFMKLRGSSPSLRLLAVATILWIFFLFGMTSVEYGTRGLMGVLGK